MSERGESLDPVRMLKRRIVAEAAGLARETSGATASFGTPPSRAGLRFLGIQLMTLHPAR